MKARITRLLYGALCVFACHTLEATQTLISGVPNYDQDVFPIDRPYASVERGDCVPVACTMLHGYYDANGWPRLIPYGTNRVSENAWGIDTVVRKYKTQFNYIPESGVNFFTNWSDFLGNPLGDGIVAVTKYFEPSSSFTREDDDWTSWSRIQSYLNASRPCVLAVQPRGAIDSYKWEGSATLNGLGGGHAVCAVGWSDVGGRWVICNMGWLYTTRAWFNYDSDDDWYISQITPGGSSSGEDDDAYEDNDTIETARSISAGTISNLRCLDTLISNGVFRSSWGDWFKVTASSGQSLSVTTTFTHANGDLDLRVFSPDQTEVGSSTGTGNSESVSVSPTTAGSYYIFVYGSNNAKNQNYSLAVSLTTPTVAVTIQTSPSGRSFSVDGTTYTSSQTFNWTSGSTHTIATTSPQSGSTGVQYVWSSWSDGGAISHNVSPTSGTTYTANFTTQYYLTMNAGTGGTVSPSSVWQNSGASVSISATPNSGYSFSSWTGSGSGSYSGNNNPASITMNGPITENASFNENPPPPPIAYAATTVTSSGFTANWSSVSGATGYRLDVSTSSTFASFVSGYQDLDVGNVLTKAVSGLSAGTTYYYRVRAYNTSGTSANSATITTATAGPAIALMKQGNNLIMSWPTNDLAFKLFYTTNPATMTWISNTVSPSIVSGRYTITNNMTNSFKLYRLKK